MSIFKKLLGLFKKPEAPVVVSEKPSHRDQVDYMTHVDMTLGYIQKYPDLTYHGECSFLEFQQRFELSDRDWYAIEIYDTSIFSFPKTKNEVFCEGKSMKYGGVHAGIFVVDGVVHCFRDSSELREAKDYILRRIIDLEPDHVFSDYDDFFERGLARFCGLGKVSGEMKIIDYTRAAEFFR